MAICVYACAYACADAYACAYACACAYVRFFIKNIGFHSVFSNIRCLCLYFGGSEDALFHFVLSPALCRPGQPNMSVYIKMI